LEGFAANMKLEKDIKLECFVKFRRRKFLSSSSHRLSLCRHFGIHPRQIGFAYDPTGASVCRERLSLGPESDEVSLVAISSWYTSGWLYTNWCQMPWNRMQTFCTPHICWQSQVPRHQVLAASKIASEPGRAGADVFVAVLYELLHKWFTCVPSLDFSFLLYIDVLQWFIASYNHLQWCIIIYVILYIIILYRYIYI